MMAVHTPWWFLVQAILLLIAGVESNPGPRKGSKHMTGRIQRSQHTAHMTEARANNINKEQQLVNETALVPNETALVPNEANLPKRTDDVNHDKPQIQMPANKRLCIRAHSPSSNDKTAEKDSKVILKSIAQPHKPSVTLPNDNYTIDDTINNVHKLAVLPDIDSQGNNTDLQKKNKRRKCLLTNRQHQQYSQLSMKRSRENKTYEQKFIDKHKNTKYRNTMRQTQSNEEKELDKLNNKKYKQTFRANRTPDENQLDKKTNTQYRGRLRAIKDPEQKECEKKTNTQYRGGLRAIKDPEQKECEKKTNTQYRGGLRAIKDPEQKECEKKTNTQYRGGLRAIKDPEQKECEKKTNTQYRGRLRAIKDPEQKECEKKTNTQYRRGLRAIKDPEQKECEKNTNTQYRGGLRAIKDPEQKECEKKTNTQYRGGLRAMKDPEQKECEKKTNTQYRGGLRAIKDPEQKECEKKTNTQYRGGLRAIKHPEQKECEKNTNTQYRGGLRAIKDPEQKECEKNKNTQYRGGLRAIKDPEQKECEKKTNTQYRGGLRAIKDPEQKECEKKTSTQYRGSLRANKDPEQKECEKKTNTQYRGSLRANKDPEQKECEKKTNTQYRGGLRAIKDPKQKECEKKTNTQYRGGLRAIKDPEQKECEKKTNTHYRGGLRAIKDPEQKEFQKKTNTQYRGGLRAIKDPEQKECEKKTNTQYRGGLRAIKTPEDQECEKDKNKIHKRTVAANKTPDQTEIEKQHNTLYRKKLRSCKNPEEKEGEREMNRASHQHNRVKLKNKHTSIEFLEANFKKKISAGPICVCICCKRLLYRRSVLCYNPQRYRGQKNKLLTDSIPNYYGPDGRQWICKTCDISLKNNKLPAQSERNRLSLETVDSRLKDLCPLEIRLISQRLPFMQIASLPKGGQKGIKGAVVNVPSQLASVVENLPRLPSDCGLVPIKLKKKLKYKGHSMYQAIRPRAMMEGLQELKKCNPLYKDVIIDDDWIDHAKDVDTELCNALFEDEMDSQIKVVTEEEGTIHDNTQTLELNSENKKNNDTSESQSLQTNGLGIVEELIATTNGTVSIEGESTGNEKNCAREITSDTDKKSQSDNNSDNENEDEKLRGLSFNTCLQPSSGDHGIQVYSFAPGEGQIPVSMLRDDLCEVLSFPNHFPSGSFGLHDPQRTTSLTCKRYFNQRLLNVDPRFACDSEYLFFSQYMTEIQQINSNISIALRKGKATSGLNVGKMKNPDTIQDILKHNEGFHFLQTVRGSQPYWEKTLLDLFAMVKQLHIPTWFCTFSAADLRWPEAIRIIAQQHGQDITDEEVLQMDWQQRTHWIRANPVTAARHFEFRANTFLHDVLMSEAQPVGHITDHFIRVEFQQRGSPHLHCMFWIKDAPKLHTHDDEEVAMFIDKFISGTMPDDSDDELTQLVSTLQKHTHSGACRKSGQECRFHFPKPPSSQTLIATPPTSETINPATIIQQKQCNLAILAAVHKKMQESPDLPYTELMQAAQVPSELYQKALKETASQPTVILRRETSDVNINNYNRELLQIWKANMDIQYVTNPWACAMYILSYISKSERNMGQLLKEAAKECKKDATLSKQMKQIGNVFLTHREVSAQEAVYRSLSMPLKQSSRQVIFLNTSPPTERTRILKPSRELADLPEDSTAVFQTNILDRYAARPDTMEDTCLADFASGYRLLGSKENKEENKEEGDSDSEDEHKNDPSTSRKDITLKLHLGKIAKRRKRAVLRSPRFSKVKQSEKYYHSLLMLYLPWRSEDDILSNFPSFEHHFNAHQEKISETLASFETDDGLLDEALDELKSNEDHLQHAWDNIAPSTEQTNEDDKSEGSYLAPEFGHLDPAELRQFNTLPEFASPSAYSVEIDTKQLSSFEYSSLVRSLNIQQRNIFDHVLNWCREVLHSRKTLNKLQPFHIFLTGGAGTGKSHLIAAVSNMARRELRALCESDEEVTVVLTAPTGIAATNINGLTIHHMFSIPVRPRKTVEYQSLSHDKLATMRLIFRNLKILIIDEVSMVGQHILMYIHRRLQDIMGITDPNVYFGGVSVLAVGDLYQLPPVLQQPIYGFINDPYVQLCPVHIWKDLFHLAELTEIMRQKDDAVFCNLLNRLRTGDYTPEDLEVLKERIVASSDADYPSDALHVFATNDQCHSHNTKMLNTLEGPILSILATDRTKDSETGKVHVHIPDDPSKTGGLRSTLQLAKGARVMLLKNINVQDGLVNGVQGTVVNFLRSSAENRPFVIVVRFDNPETGQLQRQQFQTSDVPEGCTPIFQEEIKFPVGHHKTITVTRKQFPLNLSFACTIHKVQGLSLDKIVISFEHGFNAGQAYVALSRAKTLKGVFITHFDEKKIRTSKNIHTEMTRLRKEMPLLSNQIYMSIPAESFKVAHLNTRSLALHITDIASHQHLLSSDVICISESWLSQQHDSTDFTPSGYQLFRRDRHQCYQHKCNHSLLVNKCSKCNDKGGVAILVREGLPTSGETHATLEGIEALAVSIQHPHFGQIHILTAYRPQHVSKSFIVSRCRSFLQTLPTPSLKIVAGDFNVDLTKETPLTNEISTKENFVQAIKCPTHISGSLLDHIYVNTSSVISGTLPAYYSDHDAVYIALSSSVQEPSPVKLCDEPRLCDEQKPSTKLKTERKLPIVTRTQTERTKLLQVPNPKPGSQKAKSTTNQSPYIAVHTTGEHSNTGRSIAGPSTAGPSTAGPSTAGPCNLVPSIMGPSTAGRFSTEPPTSAPSSPVIVAINTDRLVFEHLQCLTKQEKQTIANKLHLKMYKDIPVDPTRFDARYVGYIQNLQLQTPNCTIDNIDGDGNCFFRAVSKDLFGTENYHTKLRKITCDFIQDHRLTFMNWIDGADAQFENHIRKMRKNRTWATMTELVATATLFKCTIMQFTEEYNQKDWQWIQIQPTEIHDGDPSHDSVPLQGHIYIHHTMGVHYDRIIPTGLQAA